MKVNLLFVVKQLFAAAPLAPKEYPPQQIFRDKCLLLLERSCFCVLLHHVHSPQQCVMSIPTSGMRDWFHGDTFCMGPCYNEEKAFWRAVVKDTDHFPGLHVLVRYALVLCPSSVECEGLLSLWRRVNRFNGHNTTQHRTAQHTQAKLCTDFVGFARSPGADKALRGGRHGQKLHSEFPPKQVAGRGTADACSSADACLS